MPVPRVLADAKGEWKGTSKLHLNWPPGKESVTEGGSTMKVVVFNDEYAVVHYGWEYEGKTERGSLIAATGKRGTTFGWADSWHQNREVMLLSGEGADCNGKYQVEGHPEWGWRISFAMQEDRLVMRMFNISPEGEEEWAVEAVYDRDQ